MLVQNNGYCLDQCPSNHYVDSDQNCQPCSKNPLFCQNLHKGELTILRTGTLKAVISFNQQIKTFSASKIEYEFVDRTDETAELDYQPQKITIDANRLIMEFSYQALNLYELTIKIPYAEST